MLQQQRVSTTYSASMVVLVVSKGILDPIHQLQAVDFFILQSLLDTSLSIAYIVIKSSIVVSFKVDRLIMVLGY